MAKKRITKREPMPDWLYDFITKGIKPDNTKMKDFKQKPGTWRCFIWSQGPEYTKANTIAQPLPEVKEYYKEEISARLKAEKRLKL